jgi:hypothetical protein
LILIRVSVLSGSRTVVHRYGSTDPDPY